MRLDQRKFEQWLRAKHPDEIVGQNRDCHSCPLALYYAEASGGCEVVISDDSNGGYVIDRGHSKRQLPAWASTFVFKVDGDFDGIITARRALELLSKHR